MQPGEIHLAAFPFGDAPVVKLRPVLLDVRRALMVPLALLWLSACARTAVLREPVPVSFFPLDTTVVKRAIVGAMPKLRRAADMESRGAVASEPVIRRLSPPPPALVRGGPGGATVMHLCHQVRETWYEPTSTRVW